MAYSMLHTQGTEIEVHFRSIPITILKHIPIKVLQVMLKDYSGKGATYSLYPVLNLERSVQGNML